MLLARAGWHGSQRLSAIWAGDQTSDFAHNSGLRTAVIAGLISGKNSTTVSKVPLIGDIPLIGRVFSTERAVKQKSEVTIFITPRIIH